MTEKYGTARQVTDNILERMCFTWWVTADTDTHSEYVTLTAFMGRQWLRERASLLCQVHSQPGYNRVLLLVPVTYITLTLVYLRFLLVPSSGTTLTSIPKRNSIFNQSWLQKTGTDKGHSQSHEQCKSAMLHAAPTSSAALHDCQSRATDLSAIGQSGNRQLQTSINKKDKRESL